MARVLEAALNATSFLSRNSGAIKTGQEEPSDLVLYSRVRKIVTGSWKLARRDVLLGS